MPPSSASTWEILDAFSSRSFRREPQPLLENDAGRALLREALLAAVHDQLRAHEASSSSQPPVMFGVCASSGAAARFALERYTHFVLNACEATASSSSLSSFASSLRHDITSEPELRLTEAVSRVEDHRSPTYIKLAPGLHFYATPLPGNDRGVILQLGDRQCSHLPLGLFGTPGTPASMASEDAAS